MTERPKDKLFTRRNMMKAAGTVALATGLVLTAGETYPQINAHRPEISGFTFSPWQCENLGLLTIPTLKQLLSLEPDAVRLGSYWDRMEPQPGRYNFKDLEEQLNEINKATKRISIILVVGMKAPRYPEFFFPSWVRTDSDINLQRADIPLDANPKLADAATNFALRAVEFSQKFPNIDYIQFENEPFNTLSVTRQRYLSENYVRNLIDEGKKIIDQDSQKTLLTYSLSAAPFPNDETTKKLMITSRMANSAGKNLYINAPGYSALTGELMVRNAFLQRIFLNAIGVEDWVSECQAEPWERNGIFPLKTEYPSASPESAYNLARLLGGRGHKRVLMWGAEFWVKQLEMGNPKWMQKMDQLFQAA